MSSRVLIVDDSLTVRMDLGEALEDVGLTVVQARDLATARAALGGDPIDLIVLDVHLPDGNGMDFLRELRDGGDHAEVPVLLLSGRAEVEDRIRGMDAGAHEFVGKPYDRDAVATRAVVLCGADPAARKEGDAPRVVLIEDSPTTREALAHALREADFEVATAEAGGPGLRLAGRIRPDALVIDGSLPDMTGADVIQRVRLDQALRGTPCLLLTASTSREHELSSLAAGADAYLRKEQGTEVLTARLRQLVRDRPRSALHAMPLQGSRVLAVDDSMTYLEELREALTRDGYDVITARSGEECLELLEVQDVDCVVLDLVMPGLSGREVCERLRKDLRWAELPVLILTSTEDHQVMLAGIEAGADDYIVKTAEFEVVRARVRAQLRRRQLEHETRRIREELQLREVAAARERAARELAESRAAFAQELEAKNSRLTQEVEERRRVEQDLEAFAFRVSHDLRAPLRSIREFSRRVLRRSEDVLAPRELDFLQRVVDSSDHMTDLVEALLQFSRMSRKPLEVGRVDVSAVAWEVAEALLQDRAPDAPEVAVEVEPGLAVEADPRLLRIVLVNLLSNAVKYSSEAAQPRVVVTTPAETDPDVIEVRDNGAGFEPDAAARIFGVFERAHSQSEFEGIGIGLATVQRILERHGGWIIAEGRPGEGATFRFRTRPDEPPAHTKSNPHRTQEEASP